MLFLTVTVRFSRNVWLTSFFGSGGWFYCSAPTHHLTVILLPLCSSNASFIASGQDRTDRGLRMESISVGTDVHGIGKQPGPGKPGFGQIHPPTSFDGGRQNVSSRRWRKEGFGGLIACSARFFQSARNAGEQTVEINGSQRWLSVCWSILMPMPAVAIKL